jgi:hypothetical protein
VSRAFTAAGLLAACLRNEPVSWRAFETTIEDFLLACEHHGVVGLMHLQVATQQVGADWPAAVRQELAARARAAAARELLSRREVTRLFEAFAAAGISCALFKGASLASTVYDRPGLRPRTDTDLIVSLDETDRVRAVLSSLGYEPSTCCDGDVLFCQFEMARTDPFDMVHAFDVHWKISTQARFANVLTAEEILTNARGVPALGDHARAAALVHELLLACLHPVMHHRNEERLIWVADVHRLVSSLPAHDMMTFARLAVERGVGAICSRALLGAAARFGTQFPDGVLATLAIASRESTAEYLDPRRRWHDEVISSLRALPSWRDRARLVREILFPSRAYMRQAYELNGGVHERVLLPALYLFRGATGLLKVLSGRK